MGKGLVRLGHLVGVVLLLDRGTPVVEGVKQLCGQFLGHGLPGAALGKIDDPPDCQGVPLPAPSIAYLYGGKL